MTMSKDAPAQAIEILLVEDDLADIKLTRRALESARLVNKLNVVRDGVEAMRFLRRQDEFVDAPRPDIVLLDLNLPRKDGRTVLQEIKREEQLRSIPVVILTTSDAERDITSSYKDNANSYITKPIDMQRFREVVMAVTQYWFGVVKLPVR
jgi:CheY-like chemotaxis protein